MKFYVLGSLLFLAAVLISCSGPTKSDETRESLSYTYRIFRVESEGGCTSDTAQCASYEVEYPEFSQVNDAVIDSIRLAIDELASLEDSEMGTSFQVAGQQFVDQFDQFKGEFPGNGQGWFYRASVQVTYH